MATKPTVDSDNDVKLKQNQKSRRSRSKQIRKEVSKIQF
jgi:hypothetical protein